MTYRVTRNIDDDHRETEEDTRNARAHPNDTRIRSEGKNEQSHWKDEGTEHHRIETCLRSWAVLFTMLPVKTLLDRHQTIGDGNTDLTTISTLSK